MFVYQDKDHNICVTFKDNKPVKEPEYVIAISEADEALYMVAGSISEKPADVVEPEDVTEDGTEVTPEEPTVQDPVQDDDAEEGDSTDAE